MKRADLETLARSALAECPEHRIEHALLRAVGKRIVCWTNLTCDELARVYAACRTEATMAEATS